MTTTRDKLNVSVAVLLGLTIFMIPWLLLGKVTRGMAIRRNRRPWLWYWLGVAAVLPAVLALVWLPERPEKSPRETGRS